MDYEQEYYVVYWLPDDFTVEFLGVTDTKDKTITLMRTMLLSRVGFRTLFYGESVKYETIELAGNTTGIALEGYKFLVVPYQINSLVKA